MPSYTANRLGSPSLWLMDAKPGTPPNSLLMGVPALAASSSVLLYLNVRKDGSCGNSIRAEAGIVICSGRSTIHNYSQDECLYLAVSRSSTCRLILHHGLVLRRSAMKSRRLVCLVTNGHIQNSIADEILHVCALEWRSSRECLDPPTGPTLAPKISSWRFPSQPRALVPLVGLHDVPCSDPPDSDGRRSAVV